MSSSFYIGFFLAILSFILYTLKYSRVPFFNKMRHFLLFLFCMFFFEIIGLILKNYNYPNGGLYNLLSLLEFNLLFTFYSKNSENKLTKRIINICFFLYNVLFISSCFYYGHEVFTITYNTIAPVFGAFLVAIVLVLYLRELLLSEEIINYKKNIVFWITAGLLLYYLGTLPLTAIFNFMKSGSSFFELYRIQHILTIIMNSCFLIGLLWSLKKVK